MKTKTIEIKKVIYFGRLVKYIERYKVDETNVNLWKIIRKLIRFRPENSFPMSLDYLRNVNVPSQKLQMIARQHSNKVSEINIDSYINELLDLEPFQI
jgi:hypothetical protein